mgnify:CR=1 FL=1
MKQPDALDFGTLIEEAIHRRTVAKEDCEG